MTSSNKQDNKKKGFISVTEAAERAFVSGATIRNWIAKYRKYRIGRKVGGEYRIDPEKLNAILNGSIPKKDDKKKQDKGTAKKGS